MPVKLAKSAGFCMGVRRAMNAVLDATRTAEKKIYTFGPLVHNHQAMEMLKAKGVEVINDTKEIRGDGILFIRAHGIPPHTMDELKKTKMEIRDYTCPHVKKAQLLVQKYANEDYNILIIGDPGHAEVIGLLGYSKNKGIVINSINDIEKLPHFKKVCVIAQTTQSRKLFDSLVPIIKEKYPNATVFDTVCNATDERQSEVIEMAKEVDCMIIVGGKHSANTLRLAQISKKEGVPTYHIETAEELKPEMLNNKTKIGVTAGASTPNWVFMAVVDKAERLLKRKPFVPSILSKILSFLVYSYIYIGAGGAALTYMALKVLNIQPKVEYLSLAFFYVLSMHLLNRYTDIHSSRLNDPKRMRLLEKYFWFFLPLSLISAIGALIISFSLGEIPFIFLLISIVGGILYNIRFMPLWLSKKVGFKTVKEIPASKDIFMAVAWAVVSVLIPILSERMTASPQVLCVFMFILLLVFLRSVIYDIKDIEGDRIIGKETIPLLLGSNKTKKLVYFLLFGMSFIAISDFIFKWSGIGFFLFPVIGYVLLYIFLFTKKIIFHGISFELMLDAQFLISGISAWLLTKTL